MRSYFAPLLLSLAAATSVAENARDLDQLKKLECQLISAVVNNLKGAPTATSFCSSLLRIPTATVTKTLATTSTSVANTQVFETTTLTTVLTSLVTTVVGTITSTADVVTETATTS
jgi:cyclophilin family peptidyl-prolyl cis-trans isomerase